ncbi:MAG: hypothetical protein ABIQ66_00260 [Novosphingobium sp.]
MTQTGTALTLMFAPGQRPDAAAVVRVAALPAENTAFSVSFQPKEPEGWLELLAMGLAYDLTGLSPMTQAPAIPAEHLFGLDRSVLDPRPEAVRIVPGPHLAAGGALIPVVRVLAGLGAELARLPGLRAVGWETARSWMAPAYFMSVVRAWLSGGVFPALGLTSLVRGDDEAMTSKGLALFTGFEIELQPLAGETAQDAARLTARVIHALVEFGVNQPKPLSDGQGRQLHFDMAANNRLLRIRRQA